MAIRRLQTRLTLLYVALFGAVITLVSAAVLVAVAANAEAMSRATLAASGRVFDRLWDAQAERLRSGAALLSRDFGFRQALATRDAATIGSSIENLRRRLDLDLALVLSPEGELLSAASPQARRIRDLIAPKLADEAPFQGVVAVDGVPYEVFPAPVLAPDLTGWLVFAERLDRAQMRSLENLSPLPLRASVAYRQGGVWLAAGQSPARVSAELSRRLDGAWSGAVVARAGGGFVLATPLPAIAAGQSVALLLTYPYTAALAPFRWLLAAVVIVGVAGLALVIGGSWTIARGVTRPIRALTEAAARLQDGENARVKVDGEDEVGRLGLTFNAMADAVADRERRIQQAALTDQETGLPNRLALEQAVVRSAGEPDDRPLFAAAFSITRFAQLRGAIGYDLSAQLVRVLGEDLQAERPNWTVARISGESLGAVFRARSLETACAHVELERQRMERSQALGEHLVDVKVLAGVSAADGPAAEPGLIRRADTALDRAREGGAAVAVFDAEAYAATLARLSLMPELRNAIAEDALALAHQPKLDARTGRVCGVECLIRWPHPTRGFVPPDRFVPLAEETGDIRALTEWVLARALRDQAALAEAGWRLPMSINLSGRLVGDAAFIDRLLELAAGAAAPLCMEITETAVIGEAEAALASIRALTAAGLAVSIDDYGSGLSSLAYLKQIPADELKLDRSLITGLTASGREALLLRSTVDLAHGLGMKVTAEGVEDATTASLLTALGCDQLQGWFVSKPLFLPDLLGFLRSTTEPQQARRA